MTGTLIRQIAIREKLSFDGGRIVIVLQEKSGRRAALRLVLHEDVVVDKPRISANDEPARMSGLDFSKT